MPSIFKSLFVPIFLSSLESEDLVTAKSIAMKKKDVVVYEGNWGDWQKFQNKGNSFACGMRQKTEAEITGDNTALNKVQFKWCNWSDWSK